MGMCGSLKIVVWTGPSRASEANFGRRFISYSAVNIMYVQGTWNIPFPQKGTLQAWKMFHVSSRWNDDTVTPKNVVV